MTGSAEKDALQVEYEVHFNRGNGWRGLDEVIRGASPVPTLEEAWQMLDRLSSINTVDHFYDGVETRIVRVERRVISPAQGDRC